MEVMKYTLTTVRFPVFLKGQLRRNDTSSIYSLHWQGAPVWGVSDASLIKQGCVPNEQLFGFVPGLSKIFPMATLGGG